MNMIDIIKNDNLILKFLKLVTQYETIHNVLKTENKIQLSPNYCVAIVFFFREF
jgi:hypothetical protein